jgi:hypothetical protein
VGQKVLGVATLVMISWAWIAVQDLPYLPEERQSTENPNQFLIQHIGV